MPIRTIALVASLLVIGCGSAPAPVEDMAPSGDMTTVQSGDMAGMPDLKMPSTACHTAGCRKFSSYCGSCTCIALIADNPDPDCGGMMVTCLTDPCVGKTVSCNHGTGMCFLQ